MGENPEVGFLDGGDEKKMVEGGPYGIFRVIWLIPES